MQYANSFIRDGILQFANLPWKMYPKSVTNTHVILAQLTSKNFGIILHHNTMPIEYAYSFNQSILFRPTYYGVPICLGIIFLKCLGNSHVIYAQSACKCFRITSGHLVMQI